MDVKVNSGDVEEKITCMDDGSEDKPKSCHSLSDDLLPPTVSDDFTVGQTHSFTEVTILSEQIPEDSELSLTDSSMNESHYLTQCHDTFPSLTLGPAHVESPVDSELHINPRDEVKRALPAYGPWSVAKDQPQPLTILLPSPTGHGSVYRSQSRTSINRRQQSLKTTVHTEQSHGDDPCASILLACLFCQPIDCLLATMRGCNACVLSLLSSLCGCEPATLEPLLDVSRHCESCGCLGVRCCLCDCSICDVCLQATECLDLGMEISQMLFH